MAGARTRARDTDRDEAINVLGAAFADGQLTREEYDARVAKALSATTLGGLGSVISDLQKPGERHEARLSRLEPPGEQASTTPSWPPSPGVPTPRRAAISAAVGVAALAFGVFVIPRVIADDRAPDSGSAALPHVDVLTPDGFRTFVDAVRARSGDTLVLDVTIGSDYGRVMVPVDATSDRYVEWIWRDGGFEAGETAGTDHDGAIRFDLERIDPDAIPDLVEQAAGLVDEPDSVYINVDPEPDDRQGQCYDVSAGNRFSEYARVYASCSGEVLDIEE